MVRIGKDTGGAGGIPQEPSEGPTGAAEAGRKFALPKSETRGVTTSSTTPTEETPKSAEPSTTVEDWKDINAFKKELEDFLNSIADKARQSPPTPLSMEDKRKLADLQSRFQDLANTHPNPALAQMFKDIGAKLNFPITADTTYMSIYKSVAQAWGMTPDRGPQEALKPIPQPPAWDDVKAFKKELDDFLAKIAAKADEKPPGTLTPEEYKELCRLESHMQNIYNDKNASYPNLAGLFTKIDQQIRAAMNSPNAATAYDAILNAWKYTPTVPPPKSEVF